MTQAAPNSGYWQVRRKRVRLLGGLYCWEWLVVCISNETQQLGPFAHRRDAVEQANYVNDLRARNPQEYRARFGSAA